MNYNLLQVIYWQTVASIESSGKASGSCSTSTPTTEFAMDAISDIVDHSLGSSPVGNSMSKTKSSIKNIKEGLTDLD